MHVCNGLGLSARDKKYRWMAIRGDMEKLRLTLEGYKSTLAVVTDLVGLCVPNISIGIYADDGCAGLTTFLFIRTGPKPRGRTTGSLSTAIHPAITTRLNDRRQSTMTSRATSRVSWAIWGASGQGCRPSSGLSTPCPTSRSIWTRCNCRRQTWATGWRRRDWRHASPHDMHMHSTHVELEIAKIVIRTVGPRLWVTHQTVPST